MKVFVDTGAWAALAIAKDEHHSKARLLFESLNEKAIRLVTSDYVLDETLTLIRFRSGHAAAVSAGRSLLNSSVLRIVPVDRPVWDAAWKIFVRFKDKHWSFTDCTSFAVMDGLEIRDAFAFDAHFQQYGKRLLS